MRYGERLQLAMDERGKALNRKISRQEVAVVAEQSRQNIGMIITGAQSPDQKLNTEANHRVAHFLRVNAHWLATGDGDMFTGVAPEQEPVSVEARQLDILLRSIPEERRVQAVQAATQLLISYLAPAPLPSTSALLPENAPLAKRSASHQR